MTNHGDDCYFFYYSTCTKGDSCPFRHCEAAMGNETVCNLWQEGRCFRPTCKFRHMEITKNRKEIPCYWENQPAGCQKPHCAFFHEKPRCIQGLFVPPDQSQSKTEEEQPEDTAAPPPVVLTTSTNPQLRGVIKTDTTEPVPSPTHPPVVINAADDDEDEDEEGEDSRVGPSPRKLPRTGETLTFGVSTLEEIRLRKALMASMRTGYGQKAEGVVNGEKENIQAFFRATSSQSRAGPPGSEVPVRSKRGVSERLGLRMPHTGGRGREGLPIRKSLAERLGGVIEEPAAPTQEGVKPVKDRLGLFSGPATAAHSGSPAEKNSVSVKDPDQIRIKTLEEIRREKAAKSQKDAPPDVPSDVPAEIPKTVRATRGVKRTVSVKEPPISNIKTFSEIHLAKKKRLEDKQARISKTAEGPVEKPASRTLGESDTPEDGKEVKVRVKTLEEIRREKAARLQAQQDTESVESKDQQSLPKKKRLLRVQKLESQNRIETSEDTPTTEKLPKPTKTGSVQVKTFEEIMREKRLRQQEGEGQASNSTDADGVRPPLKRKLPVQADPASSAPSSPADPPSVSVRKLVPLRSKAASNAQKISFQGRTGDVTETRSSTSPSEDQNQTGSTEQSGESKVRPKLNVKPSVVKLATPLRPAQKKRVAEPSAVAAVKPLNSAAAVQETPQESTCTPPQVLPSPEALLNSAVPRSPTPLQESTLGEEELQTVPVFKQSGGQKAGAAIREACSVPHSPAVKTMAQSRARRTSTTRPTSTSDSTAPAVDDFEELINQFTDDHLEEDVDPGLGEDDLLQELSEMIDS